MSFDRDGWIKNALRRASYKFPSRNTCKINARVARNQYRCNLCQGLFSNREVQLDHVEPVISVETGWVSWDEYIARLFPDIDGWQLLCVECHQAKSIEENSKRKRK